MQPAKKTIRIVRTGHRILSGVFLALASATMAFTVLAANGSKGATLEIRVSTTAQDLATWIDVPANSTIIHARLTVVGPHGTVVHRQEGEWDTLFWQPIADAPDGRYKWEALFVLPSHDASQQVDGPAKNSGREMLLESGVLYIHEGILLEEQPLLDSSGSELGPEAIQQENRSVLTTIRGNNQDRPGMLARSAGAILDFLIPSAAAADLVSDQLIIEGSNPNLDYNDTDSSDIPNWAIFGEESAYKIYYNGNNLPTFGISSTAPGGTFSIHANGGACASSNSQCDFTGNEFFDLSLRSGIPGIEWLDADQAQEWGLFADVQSFRLADRTAGNETLYVQAGTREAAMYISSNAGDVGDLGGDIGLGTTAPESLLHLIDGAFPDIRFDDGIGFAEIEYSAGILGIDSDNSTPGDRAFNLDLGGSPPNDSFSMAADGDVGLGTGTPATALHVSKDTSATIRAENTSGTTAERVLFQLFNNGKTRFSINNTGAGEIWTFDNTGVSFDISRVGTGSAEFRVLNSGDVRMDQGEAFAQAFNVVSSRTEKTDIEPIDDLAILQRIGELEVAEWRYKTDTEGKRHIGPFAEDFASTFGVGDGKHISIVDIAGVSFSAIKALRSEVEEKNDRIEVLETNLAALSAELEKIKAESR